MSHEESAPAALSARRMELLDALASAHEAAARMREMLSASQATQAADDVRAQELNIEWQLASDRASQISAELRRLDQAQKV